VPKILSTDLAIRALKPSKRRVDYWDLKTPAFGIRVGQHTKTFIAKVRNSRVTIGAYPDVSLADARRKAFGAKSEEAPMEASKVTFKFAYEKFKEAHCSRKKARTQHDYKRILEKHFLPELAATRLPKITSGRLAQITDKLLPTPSEHAHALAVARTFFRWCTQPPHRYIANSPLEGLRLTIAKSRKRVLTDAELVKVWNAAAVQSYPHGTVVQLLILNGQRRGEVAALRDTWIDATELTITLPDHITKNGLQHTFPVGTMAADILEGIPRREKCELLFPTRWADDRPMSGWSKYKAEMTDEVSRWTLHDIRRTFGTKLAELKVAPHVVERLLNHKFGSITNHTDGMVSAVALVYNRYQYLPEMREAIVLWEKHLASLLAQDNAIVKAA
jgi:integrase